MYRCRPTAYNFEQVVSYALLLDNVSLAAKVGHYLEQRRETLYVDDIQLERLRGRRPRQPRYIDPIRRDARFVPG